MPPLSSDPHEALFYSSTNLAFGGEIAEDVYPQTPVVAEAAPAVVGQTVVTALNSQASGSRVTGLTPTVIYARTIANAADVSAYVTVAEVMNGPTHTGDYVISYNAAQYGAAAIEIDLGASLPLAGDRYQTRIIQGYLQANVAQWQECAAGDAKQRGRQSSFSGRRRWRRHPQLLLRNNRHPLEFVRRKELEVRIRRLRP